jgi:GNAT superfamily N-acetyltransferase
VTEDRVDDWAAFFDHDAFVGTPEWAACYCLEPHTGSPDGTPPAGEHPHWRQNREGMVKRLKGGASFGYLAYVGGKPAGWVNASKRSDYSLYRFDNADTPPGEDVIGVSCFIIAPPYRRHGIAAALLDRVIEDAPDRGAGWIEAYPFNEVRESDARNFRGLRSMYEERGFDAVEEQTNHTVMRLDLRTQTR